MRWSIIRLIWCRELRDQLRDRRTLFMIAVLPVLLYPVAGFGVMQLARGFLSQRAVIGVQGGQCLPGWTPRCTALSPVPASAWLTLTPPPPGAALAGVERVTAAAALYQARQADPSQDYPPLFLRDGDRLRFPALYLESAEEVKTLAVQADDRPTAVTTPDFLPRIDRSSLDGRQVDLLLVVPADFGDRLQNDGQPSLYVLTREGDDRSRLVDNRVTQILRQWKLYLKDVRLRRKGLAPDFDEPFVVQDPARAQAAGKHASEDVFELLVRIFPFVLVMWSLAGALYPAVDLCAGEKERGTMETLLISPASREEIVWGKFLTIWLFSAATALLNLLSMGLTTWLFGGELAAGASFRPAALAWAVVLLLPLSAFFSAVSLAIGAYARSSKEGQYYLMPLFLVTMPLIFLTLAPGVELNHFYSMVPVTGVALLLQKLIAVKPPEADLWGYFVPVLAPIVLYSWLALRWAIEQFQREEVLFREAERLDVGLWLRRLFRDKEALPSTGEALFCFGLVLGLQWLSAGLGTRLPVLELGAIRSLAFVAGPPLFMALLLTTRPARGLALGLPPWWAWPAAVVMALLLVPPGAALTLFILEQVPALRQTLLEAQGVSGAAAPQLSGGPAVPWLALLVLGALPALCEELAFRGFMLSGLRRRFRPWTAILLSSFLYALFRMNVYQFAPHFLVGVVLAVLVTRTGSVWTAVVFHLVWNLVLLGPLARPELFEVVGRMPGTSGPPFLRLAAVAGCLLLAVPLLAAVWRLGGRRARDEGRRNPSLALRARPSLSGSPHEAAGAEAVCDRHSRQ